MEGHPLPNSGMSRRGPGGNSGLWGILGSSLTRPRCTSQVDSQRLCSHCPLTLEHDPQPQLVSPHSMSTVNEVSASLSPGTELAQGEDTKARRQSLSSGWRLTGKSVKQTHKKIQNDELDNKQWSSPQAIKRGSSWSAALGVTVPEMWPCVMKTSMVKKPLPPPPHFSVFWEVACSPGLDTMGQFTLYHNSP